MTGKVISALLCTFIVRLYVQFGLYHPFPVSRVVSSGITVIFRRDYHPHDFPRYSEICKLCSFSCYITGARLFLTRGHIDPSKKHHCKIPCISGSCCWCSSTENVLCPITFCASSLSCTLPFSDGVSDYLLVLIGPRALVGFYCPVWTHMPSR